MLVFNAAPFHTLLFPILAFFVLPSPLASPLPPPFSPPPSKVVWIESISGTRPGDKGEWTWTEPKVALSPELDWESDGQTRVGNPSVHYHPESGKCSSTRT